MYEGDDATRHWFVRELTQYLSYVKREGAIEGFQVVCTDAGRIAVYVTTDDIDGPRLIQDRLVWEIPQ